MINMKTIALLIPFLLLFTFGCISNEKTIQNRDSYPELTSAKSINFEKICETDFNVLESSNKQRKGYVIQNKKEYQKIIDSCSYLGKNIGFDNSLLIGVTAGSKPYGYGQHKISIVKVLETEYKLFAVVAEIVPGGAVTQASTNPTSWYLVNKTTKEIIFVEQK